VKKFLTVSTVSLFFPLQPLAGTMQFDVKKVSREGHEGCEGRGEGKRIGATVFINH
jgi:hypothetical protein